MVDGHVATLDDDTNNHELALDPDIFPRNYNDEDLNSMIPRAVALEDPGGVPTDQCICGRPTCVRCFPQQAQAPSHDGLWRENW